ncbi:MAG: hypothetical protein K8L97_15220 [Anaerolineae bacterium]|nr:hypothetical protein [Anaerolineae bacterium]
MRLVAAALLILGMFSPVMAQSDCGDGLPCGQLFWDLPPLPELQSPTPMPTFAVTVQVTQVSGGVPTPHPVPTNPALATVDTSGISDQMATLQAVVAQTPMIMDDFNGTPVDTAQTYDELVDNAETFFGYAKSISQAQFGSLSPLVAFIILAFVTILSVKTLTFTLPFVTVLFGLIRKAVSLLLDFLPF